MDTKILTCPVCWNIAKSPVETKCCSHIFCESCTKTFTRCPLCKTQDFKPTPSRLGMRMIEQATSKCPNEGCSYRSHTSDLRVHADTCEFRIRDCPICKEFKPSLLELTAHLCASHSDLLLKLLQEKTATSHTRSAPQEKRPLPEVKKEVEDLIGTKRNADLRTSKLGENGKYHCGYVSRGYLHYSGCIDKHGNNCCACMRLDIEARKLPKDHYVNSAGVICRVKEGRVYCGRASSTLLGEEKTCGPVKGPSCKECMALARRLPEYKRIWEPPRRSEFWDD